MQYVMVELDGDAESLINVELEGDAFHDDP